MNSSNAVLVALIVLLCFYLYMHQNQPYASQSNAKHRQNSSTIDTQKGLSAAQRECELSSEVNETRNGLISDLNQY